MEVFDGRQAASLSMGRFCAGEELTFLSSSNVMTVEFRSDAMITNTGFYALYDTVPQDERESGGYPDVITNLRPVPLREEALSQSNLSLHRPC